MIVVILDNAIATENGTATISGVGQLSNDLVSIIFLFISALMYGMVPTIADWVVSGSGTGMFASAAGSAMKKTAGLAAGFAGAKIAEGKLKGMLNNSDSTNNKESN